MRYGCGFGAVGCLFLLAACQADKRLLIDPERRGFELPPSPQILFFVDGLRLDALEQLRAQGKLPRLERTLFARSARVRTAVTSVPSVTYANAVTMLTGLWPSSHGVWANVNFNRQEFITRNFEVERANAADDAAHPTMFEMMPGEWTVCVAMPFSRGSKVNLAMSMQSGGASPWLAWILGRKEYTDLRLAEQLFEIGEQSRQIGEWPAFIAIHLPAVDSIGHEFGSDSKEYREAVENLDEAIGGTLETLEQGGMLDQLTIVLTSDHGHLPTPRSAALAEFLSAALDVPVTSGSDNDGGVAYLQRWQHYSPSRVIATVTGERVASLHLRTGTRWRDRPSLEEILGFPAFLDAGDAPLPEILLYSPAVDLVAVRGGDDEVRVYSRRGSAAIRRTRGEHEPSFRYEVLSGEDPLEHGAELREWIEDGAHTSREWLAATAGAPHPDAVPQLVTAFGDARSGDVMLFATPGWDFSPKYLGGHGGLEREEMIVPLYIAGPGIRAGAEVSAARLVDLAPTLLELSGRKTAEQRFDGVSFAAALR